MPFFMASPWENEYYSKCHALGIAITHLNTIQKRINHFLYICSSTEKKTQVDIHELVEVQFYFSKPLSEIHF